MRDKIVKAHLKGYAGWRKGKAKGAHGESDIVGWVAIDDLNHSVLARLSSAGDKKMA